MSEHSWYTYLLECTRGVYCGVTIDIKRREREHNNSKKQVHIVKLLGIPAKMVYWEEHPTQSTACKREWVIKQLTRKQKLELIATKNPA